MGYQKQDHGGDNQDLFHGRSSLEANEPCHRFAKDEVTQITVWRFDGQNRLARPQGPSPGGFATLKADRKNAVLRINQQLGVGASFFKERSSAAYCPRGASTPRRRLSSHLGCCLKQIKIENVMPLAVGISRFNPPDDFARPWLGYKMFSSRPRAHDRGKDAKVELTCGN
jgi:hypothetical protein